ncbi:MAG: molybdopterin oxidoreductase, partial [Planctomycetaceae bacterium]|nr:molybdopterin oxidoreductase [Planctomycetaceae bacterium]
MNFNVEGYNQNTSSALDEEAVSVPRGNAACHTELSLIAQLLQEQQSLTAVDQFAKHYAAQSMPAQSRYYADLIPAAAPQSGEQ